MRHHVAVDVIGLPASACVLPVPALLLAIRPVGSQRTSYASALPSESSATPYPLRRGGDAHPLRFLCRRRPARTRFGGVAAFIAALGLVFGVVTVIIGFQARIAGR
ncbi:MAG: hypothetical protein M3O70_09415 [Actinomycetota bacterium]|nr:hypothetical protein [Actinomycetota bacterium]